MARYDKRNHQHDDQQGECDRRAIAHIKVLEALEERKQAWCWSSRSRGHRR